MQGINAINSPDNNALNSGHHFNLEYAPHFNRFKNHAGNDLIDQLNFMADQGNTTFEDNGMMKRDIATQIKIGGGGVTVDKEKLKSLESTPLKKGTISLQSESHSVEFRNIEIIDL